MRISKKLVATGVVFSAVAVSALGISAGANAASSSSGAAERAIPGSSEESNYDGMALRQHPDGSLSIRLENGGKGGTPTQPITD